MTQYISDNAREWLYEVKNWLKEQGIQKFAYCELPSHLKNYKNFRKAAVSSLINKDGRKYVNNSWICIWRIN